MFFLIGGGGGSTAAATTTHARRLFPLFFFLNSPPPFSSLGIHAHTSNNTTNRAFLKAPRVLLFGEWASLRPVPSRRRHDAHTRPSRAPHLSPAPAHKHTFFPPHPTSAKKTDEATSALDASTEREILDALALLSKGRTSIFVAHRLSTAAQCDQIVVLGPGGRVAESGTHAGLLSKPGGAYAALWAHQSGGVDEAVAVAERRRAGEEAAGAA